MNANALKSQALPILHLIGLALVIEGVYWNAQRSKWQAKIRRGQLEKHLGLFVCKEDAAEAYRRAAADVFGEFACVDR